MPLGVYAKLFIPGPMPGMNEILAARGRVASAQKGSHKRTNKYAELKQHWAGVVQAYAMQARLRPGQIPAAHFTFLHFERDRLRDPDNLCGGAQKLLLDSLKTAGLIANDGWKHVLGIRHHWLCVPAADGFQCVGVQLYAAADTLTEREAHELALPIARRVEMIPRATEAARADRSKRAARLAG